MAWLDASMMDHHPYHKRKNPRHDYDSKTLAYLKGTVYNPKRREKFVSRVKKFLKDQVDAHIEQEPEIPIVLAMPPGHTPDSKPGFLQEVIRELVREYPRQLIDGSTQLVRIKEVPSSAVNGNRGQDMHQNSIEVCAPPGVVETLNAGRVVFIIDDVSTTGATLTVCGEKIRTTGPLDVKLYAVGKTVYYKRRYKW